MDENSSVPIINEEEEFFEKYRVVADENQSLLRLDRFLLDRLGNVSRNRLQQAIKAGLITVNEKPSKANYKVKPRDEVSVFLPKPEDKKELLPQKMDLDIVFEDDDLIVVNKPAGLVVHPAIGNWDGTLVNGLLYHFNELPRSNAQDIRPGLVHRIDKHTSGLLIIAKNEESHAILAKQFFDHTVNRSYLALVWGDPGSEGSIEASINRSARDRKIRTVVEEGKGKLAISHFSKKEDFGPVSLMECRLETGRTHQIRVHFQHIGHPLFGDPEYGGRRILKGPKFTKYKVFVEKLFKDFQRQALHAQTLGFVHPKSGEEIFLESTLPEDMAILLEKWRGYSDEGLG
jgi:23S rRNA pseudouridine1911/1915/1917 synthase